MTNPARQIARPGVSVGTPWKTPAPTRLTLLCGARLGPSPLCFIFYPQQPSFPLSERFPAMQVKWSIGAIVHHKKYDYRGVIVSFDPRCRADNHWYRGNRTQPSREQPWYHVLVDSSETTTYVAEENLELAVGTEPIQHPLLTHFFSTYYQGHYYSHALN